MMHDEIYMKKALELARIAAQQGEVPVGAVVVKKSTGEIVGRGFNPDKVFDIVMGYLKFESEDYGLTGVAGIVAGTVFSISLYTSLIAIGLTFWPVLLIAGAIAIFQTMSVADLWPW